MRNPFKALVIALCLVGLPWMSQAFAQAAGQETKPGEAAPQAGRILVDANSLKGATVKDADGKNVAKLEQIMIDTADGRVAYAVLGFGGAWGFGNKLVAVPWNGLKLAQDQKTLVLNMDRDLLEKAPRFERGQTPNLSQR